jgi:uncharacterized protein (TIGR02466 family)
MNIESYFPVPVLHHNIDSQLADKVESIIVPKIKELERNHENTQFTDYFENKINVHELLPELIDEWVKAISYFRSVTSINIDENQPLQYWTQDYKEGDTHPVHHHSTGGISGVYWVRANDAAGDLRLHTTNPLSEYVKVTNNENPYFTLNTDIKTEKGKIVLFPSYLKHEVLKSNADAIRTTIAFNLLG